MPITYLPKIRENYLRSTRQALTNLRQEEFSTVACHTETGAVACNGSDFADTMIGNEKITVFLVLAGMIKF